MPKVEFHKDNVWMVESTLQDAVSPPEGGFQLLHGQIANFEVEAPHLALRRSDKIQIFLQTDAGRKAAGGNGGEGSASMFLGQSRFLGDSLAEGSTFVITPPKSSKPAGA